MPDLISAMSAVMRAEIESLNTVAQNNANVNTRGYRAQRSVIASENFLEMISTGQNQLDLVHRATNANGSIEITNRAFDLAITGDAWFAIEGPEETLLTRNGKFHVNKENLLVNVDGYSVLGEGGPITVDSLEMNVSASGQILFDSTIADQLQLYASDKVLPAGNGLYKSGAALEPAENYKIVQGALEKSNVDTSEEMVRLMETTRHIESLQRAMSTYDDLLETGIGEIGN